MKSEDEESTPEVKLPSSEDNKSIEAEESRELRRSKRPNTDDTTALPGLGENMGVAVATGKVATAGSADGSSNASGSSASRMGRKRKVAKRESSSQSGGRVRLPDKLLMYLKDKPTPGVIWWMPDGNGFAYDIDKVQSQFLDVYFRGTKLASFVRSLNRWGFRRVFYHALPENVNAFYHPKFKRDHPERVKEITMAPLPKSQGDEEEATGKDEEEETTAPIQETGTLQEQQCPQVPPQAQQQQATGQGGQPMASQPLAAGSVIHNPQQQVQSAVTGDQQQAAIAAMVAMMQPQGQQGQFPTAQHVQQQQQAPPSVPAPMMQLQLGQAIWQMLQGLQQTHGQPQFMQQQQQPQIIQQVQQQPQMGFQQAPFQAPQAHQNHQVPQYQHGQQQQPAQQFIILQHPPQAAPPPAQHLPGSQGSQQLQNPQQNAFANLAQPQQMAQLIGFAGQQGHGASGQQLQAAIQHLVQQGLAQAMQQQQQLQQNRSAEQAPQEEDPENKEPR